jgi:hypothetical protein
MKLLKILLEIYREEYYLNLKEGLIKTTNIGQTISILNKKFLNKYNFNLSKDKNSFSISTFHFKLDNLQQLINQAETLGWFPSWIEMDKYTGKFNLDIIKDGDEGKIIFEAKFDIKIDNIPNILYHLSPKQNWEKISKIGLVPKSRSKASYHPERVYLGKTEKDIISLAPLFHQKTGNKEYVVLKINTELIPGDYLQLYKDPNFKNGYYTLNNIPFNVIEKVKEINL